jgi:hypothetical protein
MLLISQSARVLTNDNMKLSDLTLQSLDLVQGMEKHLRQRQRKATGSLAVAAAGMDSHRSKAHRVIGASWRMTTTSSCWLKTSLSA